MRPISQIIKARPVTVETARADWEGRTQAAQFQGAAQADKAQVSAVVFGKKAPR